MNLRILEVEALLLFSLLWLLCRIRRLELGLIERTCFSEFQVAVLLGSNLKVVHKGNRRLNVLEKWICEVSNDTTYKYWFLSYKLLI